MDTKEYSQGVINRFRQKKLFFNDPVFETTLREGGDVSKFLREHIEIIKINHSKTSRV